MLCIMPAFDQEHLVFNRGWRWKVERGDKGETQVPFTLDSGDEFEVLRGDLEEERVVAGYLMFFTISATGDGARNMAVDLTQEIPGPSGRSLRRSGTFNVGELLDIGQDNPAIAGTPVATQTVVNGVDVYAIGYNGFAALPTEVRFPEDASVVLANQSDSNSFTVQSYRAGTQLIHKPKLFFKQVRAYNILTGNIPEDRYDLDEERTQKYIDAILELDFESMPEVTLPEEEES